MAGVVQQRRVLALDLSLTATGAWWGDPYNPSAPFGKAEIKTPDRRKGESDMIWNAHRLDHFQEELLEILEAVVPEVVVVEVTTHAHQIFTRARGTAQERREKTTRGVEFRAGLGLGRALGWLDATLYLAAACKSLYLRVETIEARDAKLRVAGSQAASKAAVAAKLGELWGWTTDGWRESEIDALCCAVGWLRTVEGDAKDAMFRELAARQDADGRPASSRSSGSTTPRRRTGSRPS